MKASTGLVGLLCGLAATLLFLSGPTGGLAATFLLYLSPLPVFVAGLGWGSPAAAIAAGFGTMLATVAMGIPGGLLFMAMPGAVPYWMVHKALLNRPIGEVEGDEGGAGSDEIEWYPPGFLIAWAAGLTASLLLIADIAMRASGVSGGMMSAVHVVVQALFESQPEFTQLFESPDTGVTSADIVNIVAAMMPAVAGVIWSLTLVGTLWLAQSMLTRSGRNQRPWAPFKWFELPPQLTWALIAAAVVSLVPTSFAAIAGTLAVVLLTPFFLLGVAVIHVISAPWTLRPLWLGLFYFLLVLTGWIAIPVAILGLVETRLHLRFRAHAAGIDKGGRSDDNA